MTVGDGEWLADAELLGDAEGVGEGACVTGGGCTTAGCCVSNGEDGGGVGWVLVVAGAVERADGMDAGADAAVLAD